ncbi:hypothetical protein [Actinokineospora sp. NBRC 105648]|uniref:hypothetical protein n=1 Tax=Actinokineospora sp. NBRC 105648 TaxID=3032206 RepID=UPI002554B994|nr:hypothetical protein [Actinokineospora sp. NBRC 105648]
MNERGRAPIRTVRVGDPAAPGSVLVLRLRWLCPDPACRRPRGDVERVRLDYHRRSGPPTRVSVDRWRNPCGHLDLVRDVIAEAAALTDHQADTRARQCATPTRTLGTARTPTTAVKGTPR